MARVRLVERREPPRDRAMARAEELRRAAVDRRMAAWFDELKARYPVRILDRTIGAIRIAGAASGGMSRRSGRRLEVGTDPAGTARVPFHSGVQDVVQALQGTGR
jgi:hypothetical protein